MTMTTEAVPQSKVVALLQRDSDWRTGLVVTMLAAGAVLAIFFRTISDLVGTWRFGTFSHGYVILPVVIYLAWLRRAALTQLVPRSNLWLLPVLALLAAVWLLGNVAEVRIVQQLAVVAMLPTLVWMILGTAVARTLGFPLAFLLLAVPMGANLIGPLQDFTAAFVIKALDLSGIPVLGEGRYLTLASGRWEVAEACSGVRYLISTLVLGLLYAWMVYRSWRRRLLFMLACATTPILANALRAYGIVLLAHLTNRRLAVGVDHVIYGWFFFLIVTSVLFVAGMRWREQPAEMSPQVCARGPAVTASASSKLRTVIAGLVGVMVVAAAPIYAHAITAARPEPSIRLAAPAVTAPWQATELPKDDWSPVLVNVDAELKQAYAFGSREAYLYVGYYASQRPGAQVLNVENRVFDGMRWSRLSEAERQVKLPDGTLDVHETVISSAHGTRVVWSWYMVGGTFTSNPYRTKLLQARSVLLGGSRTAALVAVAADQETGGEATAVLQDVLQHLSLRALLEQPLRSRE